MTLFSSSPFVIDFHCVARKQMIERPSEGSEKDRKHAQNATWPMNKSRANIYVQLTKWASSFIRYSSFVFIFFLRWLRARAHTKHFINAFIRNGADHRRYFFYSIFQPLSFSKAKMLIFASKFPILATFAQIFTRSRIVDNTFIVVLLLCSVCDICVMFSTPFRL